MEKRYGKTTGHTALGSLIQYKVNTLAGIHASVEVFNVIVRSINKHIHIDLFTSRKFVKATNTIAKAQYCFTQVGTNETSSTYYKENCVFGKL